MRRFSYPERMRHVFHQVHAMPLRMRPSTSAEPLLSLWGRAFTGAAHASPGSHRAFAHARQAGTSHHIHKTRPLPFGPALLRVRQLFRQAYPSPAPGFAKRTHHATFTKPAIRLAARPRQGCGGCSTPLILRLRLDSPSGHIIPHSLNSPFALRLGLVKGVASVPLSSPFAFARAR